MRGDTGCVEGETYQVNKVWSELTMLGDQNTGTLLFWEVQWWLRSRVAAYLRIHLHAVAMLSSM